MRENLGSLWLHLKLIGGPAWPLSSKLSKADAEGTGLQSLSELQGCIWPAGGSTAPLQFLAHPWWHAQSCLLSRQEETEVWFILTITEALRLLVTIDEALASHIFPHVIILSICFPEENRPESQSDLPKVILQLLATYLSLLWGHHTLVSSSPGLDCKDSP